MGKELRDPAIEEVSHILDLCNTFLFSLNSNNKIEEEMRQAIDNYLDLLKIGVKEVP